MGLLDDKSSSDADSEGGSLDFDRRLQKSQWVPLITAPFAALRNVHWRQLFVRFLIFLVPSFLQGRHMREQIRPAKVGPTAYLDGMRGLAALFVYFCHYTYQAFIIAESWGCGDNNFHILKLPFLRLFYQGPPAVCVFFVISGYALCYKPLKQARNRQFADFAGTMSSMTFRRFIRLYVPTTISTFMIVCLLRMGAYDLTRDFATDRTFHKNIMEPHLRPMESAYAQWIDWFWSMWRFIHVWDWAPHGGSTDYDVHLWTIPIEFRCSLYLFLVILGSARLQTKFRWLVVGGVTWFTYRNSRWEFTLFLAGFFLAELDHIRGAHIPQSPLPQDEKNVKKSNSQLKSFFWGLASILALYLMCQPDGRGEITPGWIWLDSQIPSWWGEERFRYWQGAGAILFVLSVGFSKTWQKFFNTGIVQYFGKLSYALYLMHGPAMHCVGYHFEAWAYSVTGVEGYWFNAGWCLGACFCIPTVIWWADIFWRAVDIPTVKFGRWVETKFSIKP
ncbi:hypothetical protein N3K66_004547 [Trichothecium roseum]|uniref:Uncharacterized protein n=1 Tax=Trichothecium roseum TaxID=47278 RepID=A0ACC0V1K2_9HYPO|nr:hypothetical protein N3K66_004547 [Trichothecium roseum]